MPRIHLMNLALPLGLIVAPLAAQSAPQPTGTATAPPIAATEQPADELVARGAAMGPIHAEDPEVRAEIRSLYEQRADLVETSLAELRGLNEELRTGADAARSAEIRTAIRDLKINLEVRGMEIGLEIAQLNEDAPRIAEYSLALDQVRNPASYLPAPVTPLTPRERDEAVKTQPQSGTPGQAVVR
ncbi:MAG: hypothetical protein HKN12_10225 [Gemmatimonadetes bacterium]|nr:hypothetical protein [Gemmatimonadota bacterium]